ncbi:hypothetical protein Tco_0109793 [Tanacetum coccineum]
MRSTSSSPPYLSKDKIDTDTSHPSQTNRSMPSISNETKERQNLLGIDSFTVIVLTHEEYTTSWHQDLNRRSQLRIAVIMEYLVKISKKARILELKRIHLKITVLTSYTPYPSRKIRRIGACNSLKTTKEQGSICHIQKSLYTVFKI